MMEWLPNPDQPAAGTPTGLPSYITLAAYGIGLVLIVVLALCNRENGDRVSGEGSQGGSHARRIAATPRHPAR